MVLDGPTVEVGGLKMYPSGMLGISFRGGSVRAITEL